MNDLDFFNSDPVYGLKLEKEHVKRIWDLCIGSYPNETGGIIIGTYNSDQTCANVTMVTGPPKDSRKGRTWFIEERRGNSNY